MNETTANQWIKFLGLIIVFGLILFPILIFSNYQDSKSQKHIDYYYSEQKVPFAQCKEMSICSCGVKLSGCTDGKKYYCLTDIWTK